MGFKGILKGFEGVLKGLQISSIYKFGLSVCLYPINVKTAEPIGPKSDIQGLPGRFMNHQNFKYLSPSKFDRHQIFKNFEKSAKFFVKIRELFFFCFSMYTKRTCSELIQKMGTKRPLRLVIQNCCVTTQFKMCIISLSYIYNT